MKYYRNIIIVIALPQLGQPFAVAIHAFYCYKLVRHEIIVTNLDIHLYDFSLLCGTNWMEEIVW